MPVSLPSSPFPPVSGPQWWSGLICSETRSRGARRLPDVGGARHRPYFGRERSLPGLASLTTSSLRHTISPMSAPDSPRWLNHPVIVNYGVPVLSVGAMVIIGRWLDRYLNGAPVSLFICAVMFSAWLA